MGGLGEAGVVVMVMRVRARRNYKKIADTWE